MVHIVPLLKSCSTFSYTGHVGADAFLDTCSIILQSSRKPSPCHT